MVEHEAHRASLQAEDVRRALAPHPPSLSCHCLSVESKEVLTLSWSTTVGEDSMCKSGSSWRTKDIMPVSVEQKRSCQASPGSPTRQGQMPQGPQKGLETGS